MCNKKVDNSPQLLWTRGSATELWRKIHITVDNQLVHNIVSKIPQCLLLFHHITSGKFATIPCCRIYTVLWFFRHSKFVQIATMLCICCRHEYFMTFTSTRLYNAKYRSCS